MHNKKLNVRLLVIVGATTLLGGLAVYLLHGYQVRRNAGGLLERAAAARESGNYEQAVWHMYRYLQHRPDDKVQSVQLALDMKTLVTESPSVGIKDIERAYALLEKSVRESPDDVPLRREAADFTMKLRRYPDAIAHLEYLLNSAPDQADAESKVMLGRCYAAQGDSRRAAELLGKLVGFDAASHQFDAEQAEAADSLDAYELLAAVYREKLLDTERADKVINQMVALNDQSARAHLSRARYWLAAGGERAARRRANEDLEAALRLAPEDAEVILAASEAAIEAQDFDQARTLLDGGLEKHPDNPDLYRVRSVLAQRQGKAEEALALIREGLKRVPDNPVLLRRRAELELQRGDFEAVARTVEALRQVRYPRVMIDLLEAQVLAAKGIWLEASRRLEDVRPLVSGMPSTAAQVDLLLGQSYAALGQSDRQLEAYRRVVEVSPNAVLAHVGMAEALMALGRTDEAAEKFDMLQQALGDRDSELVTRLRLSLLDLKARQQMELPPGERRWSEVDQLAETVLADDDLGPAQKASVRVNLLVRQDRREEAGEVLEAALGEFPGDTQLWLWRLNLAGGEAARASVLEAMRKALGDTVAVRLVQARMLVDGAEPDVARRLAQLEQDVNHLSADEQLELWRGLAANYFKLGDHSATRRLWRQIADQEPADLNIRISLFQLALDHGDPEEIGQAQAAIEKLAGRDSTSWKFAEASRLVWMVSLSKLPASSLREGKRLLEEIRQQRPDWSALLQLESNVHLLEGNVDAAIAALERSLEIQPGSPRVIRRLAQLLANRGRQDEAEQVLEQLTAAQRTTADERTTALLKEQQGDIAGALEIVERAVVPDSTSADDHLWHARLLARAKKLDAAEAAVRQATRLGPTNLNAWLGLIQLLAQADKRDEAEEALQQAERNLPEGQRALARGSAYQLMGDVERAERAFQEALRAAPLNLAVLRAVAEHYLLRDDADAARKHLEQLSGAAPPHSASAPAEVVWARRALARQLAARGSYPDFQKALQLIEDNVPPGGVLSPVDRLLWVALAASRPDAASRQRAMALLEQASPERPLTDAERFVLAQLYERANRWPEAEQITLELLARNSTNAAMVERWISWLLKRGDLRKVEQWERNLPEGSFARIRAQTHLLVRQGRSEQALSGLLTLLKNQPDNSPEQKQWMRAVAALLEELAEHDPSLSDPAEKVLRAIVARQPEQTLLLAAYLGRRPGDPAKLQEALQLCEAARDGNQRTARLAIAVQSLRAQRKVLAADGPEFQRVAGWLQQASTAGREGQAVLLLRSELANLRGDRRTEEAAYREYLARTDIDARQQAMVKNNLAFLLAAAGDSQQSLSLAQEAINELGPVPDLLDTRAVAYMAGKQPDKAIADLELAIAGDSAAIRHFHMALAQLMKGDEDAAARAMQQARELGLDEQTMSESERAKLEKLLERVGAKLQADAN